MEPKQTDASNLYRLSDPEQFAGKNRLYLAVREREGRVLSDEMALRLPFTAPDSRQQREWAWRRRSFSRFRRYLARRFRGREFSLLDLGCGNGWMSLRLAGLPGAGIWAADVNLPELQQGARLAAITGLSNIRFVFADILENTLPEGHFDLVVLAASVQYFPNVSTLVAALKRVLKPGGDIHFLDSPFYPDEVRRLSAREASRQYYTRLGVPEMAEYYHHHRWADVAALGGKNLNDGFISRLLQRIRYLGPFPWVRISE